MTRKDYPKLAAALQVACPAPRATTQAWAAWKRCIEEICYALEADNPRFDREQFTTAYQTPPAPPEKVK